MSKDSPFLLKSSSEDFQQRQKNVFDQLSGLTTSLENNSYEDMDVDNRRKKSTNRSPMRQFRGKESIFKRPQEPLVSKKQFFRSMPDFKKNPHKWKKYSLDDVKDEDMSDRSNTRAALSFLNELKNRNSEKNVESSNSEEMPTKIVFRKVTKIEESGKSSGSTGDFDEDKPSFRSSKVVMPEYVVGQKAKKEKRNRSLKAEKNAAGQLKLDHLLEDD